MKQSQIKIATLCFAAATCLLSGCASHLQSRDGFKPLITGGNRADWYVFLARGPLPDDTNRLVKVEQNLVHMYPEQANGSLQPFGYIATRQEFSKFHLRFEYRWGTNRFSSRTKSRRDAGVIFHMFGSDNVWPSGVECQVQEDDVGDIFTVNTRVTTTVDASTTNLATIYATNATTRKVRINRAIQPQFLETEKGGTRFAQGDASDIKRVIRNPMNERAGWNTVELIVIGDSATYLLNGKVNNRVLAMEQFVDGKWTPLTRGKIMFQLEGAEVFYRNIEIKKLKD